MFGVVLWSDVGAGKAVIWCEDHGDLAFYRKTQEDEILALGAGDWIQFDMVRGPDLRLACNPRLISEGAYQNLDRQLAAQPGRPAGVTALCGRARPKQAAIRAGGGQVLKFS